MKHLRLAVVGLLWVATPAMAALVVHLPFDRDGTAANNSQFRAQAHSGASVDSAGARLGGGVARFDGKTGFFHLSITPASSNEARSVSLWIQSPMPSQTKPNKVFLGWGGYGSEAGVRFDLCLQDEDDQQLRLEFNRGNFVVSNGRPGVNLTDGRWHHVAVVYDGARVLFYLDGSVYGDAVRPPSPLQTTSALGTALGTGAREAAGTLGPKGRFFEGLMDDVGLWNSALSASDVMLIHALAQVGDNDLRWLDQARRLADAPVGATARINGVTWTRVRGLPAGLGEWNAGGGGNSAGSFIVLDGAGGGLQITPRWWEYPVVKQGGLAAVALALLVLAAWFADRIRWRLRLRRLEAKEQAERERRRIAQDLHDELGSSLTEIISLGDLAEQECHSPEQWKIRLADITRKTRDLVGAVDEIVWTANPVNDLVPRLAGYLCDHAERFLRAKHIRCRLDVGDALPEIPIGAKTRHHILMVVKEALNNAVKHSGAEEVWLRIHCAAGGLEIVIEDNGGGFDLGNVRHGNGLSNLRVRLEEVGGQTEIETQPGRGTRVRCRLPLNHALT